ncbi:MAG: hypothetical protein HYX60_04050 [Legionella longbeachae]|nr:hypothetical protein [Legionella longbeachae]
MKLFVNLIVLLLLVVNTQAFAVRMLSYPVDQPPECNQSYDNTPEPKSIKQVLFSFRQLCLHRGGVRVTHKEVTSGNSTEPINEILSCIGENPTDYTLFNCTFPSRAK